MVLSSIFYSFLLADGAGAGSILPLSGDEGGIDIPLSAGSSPSSAGGTDDEMV
jgi:hypothetical protein